MNRNIVFVFTYFALAPHVLAEDVPTPITRLVNRPLELKSGVFEFRIESGILDPANGEWVEPADIKRFSVSIDGDDYVRKNHGFPHVSMSRGEVAASYYVFGENAPPVADRRLDLTIPQGSISLLAEKEIWAKWRLIGGLQRNSIAQYISKTPPTAQSRALIDGVQCRVFEYEIQQDQLFKVLTAVHPTMLTANSVTLRLSLAEDFGFALSRSEVLGPLGAYDVVTSKNFVEVAANVYLPVNWQHSYGPSKGVDRIAVDEIELMHFKFVNRPLPEETFKFTIPAGTAVIDRRPNKPKRNHFLLEEVSLSQFLENIESEQ